MIEQKQRFDRDASSYRRDDQTNEYSHDLGVVALPIAGRESAHRVIRLHGGIAFRTVNWMYNKNNSPPYIPAATDTGGDTLLETVVMPAKPVPTANGDGYDWAVSGTYTYVQNTPRIAGKNAFPTGNAPFRMTPQSDFASQYVAVFLATAFLGQNALTSLDDFATFAAGVVPVREGNAVHWPFTILPAQASSTHLIEG